MNNQTLLYEEIIERFGEVILTSNIRIATNKEIEEAKVLHLIGKCPHTIVYDTELSIYKHRLCATCGKGLGLV